MTKADRKHAQLTELLEDINIGDRLGIRMYHESGMYNIQVAGKGLYQPSIIGSVDEAIAFARGVKAALEVL